MRSDPLYLRLKEQIRGDLLAAKARGEDDQLATLNELQIQYQASRPTISKALTALAAEGVLIKLAGRGMFALSPNISSDAASRPTIGYIAPLTRAELPQNVFHGIDRVCHRRNFKVLMASAGESVEHERTAAHDMIAAGARGLIIYPTLRIGSAQESDYLLFENLGVPVVLIDTCIPEQGRAQVRFDNRRVGYQMTKLLLSEGHMRIALLTFTEETNHPTLELRLKGYEQAMNEAGMVNAAELVFRIVPPGKPVHLKAAVDRILSMPDRPTAIIACHDPIAVELIQELQKRGIAVPDEVTVTGFDNAISSRHFRPRFTTSNPDFDAMGEVACDMLLDAIEAGLEPNQTYIMPVPLHPWN